MIPSFQIGAQKITPYLICSLAGLFAAALFAMSLVKKRYGDSYEYMILLLWSLPGVFLGGHILYGITNIAIFPDLFFPDEPYGFLGFFPRFIAFFGGSVFYGGLFGGILSGIIAAKVRKTHFSLYADETAIVIPLFHAFGRLGCFLSGCCFGMECEVGFVYHYSLVEQANGVTRFPVQLVEAFCNALLFITLYMLYKKGRLKGKLMYVYLISYAVLRFFLEFLRGDDYRGFLFSLSTSQVISILIIATVCGYMLSKKIKRNINN